ncbi:hypothetical protein [Nocardia brevicatena]|nr:hypothetical protein [Nocardia brevicatena]
MFAFGRLLSEWDAVVVAPAMPSKDKATEVERIPPDEDGHGE